MKIRTYLLLILFVTLAKGQAQSTFTPPSKIYKAWVTLKGEHHQVKGVLYEVKDSSILVSSSSVKTDYLRGTYEVVKLDVSKITSLKLRNTRAIGTGVLIGGISGALTGLVIGVTATNTASNDKAKAGLTAASTVVSTIFMGTCGAMVGLLFGTIRTSVSVKGSQARFEKAKDKLIKRSILYDQEVISR
jgi:hypothetical protein